MTSQSSNRRTTVTWLLKLLQDQCEEQDYVIDLLI